MHIIIFIQNIEHSHTVVSRNRSFHQRCSIKIAVLKIFAVFSGKRLHWNLILITLQAKNRLQYSCFPVNIKIFFKNTCFEEHQQTAASEENIQILSVFLSHETRDVSLVKITQICKTKQEMKTNVTNIAANSHPQVSPHAAQDAFLKYLWKNEICKKWFHLLKQNKNKNG